MLPEWINVPESVCIPFQMMEHCLLTCDPQGAARLYRLIQKLTKTTKLNKMTSRLFRAKQIVLGLHFKDDDASLAYLQNSLKEFGINDF